jgi:hypothetical protein
MVARALSLFAVLTGLMVVPALAQTPGNPTPPSSQGRPSPAQACPPGTHWEEAGYVGHGKYRPARCARDNGRE